MKPLCLILGLLALIACFSIMDDGYHVGKVTSISDCIIKGNPYILPISQTGNTGYNTGYEMEEYFYDPGESHRHHKGPPPPVPPPPFLYAPEGYPAPLLPPPFGPSKYPYYPYPVYPNPGPYPNGYPMYPNVYPPFYPYPIPEPQIPAPVTTEPTPTPQSTTTAK